MNDLRDLLRENVAAPPPDGLDLGDVVRAGRRRTRRRRGAAVGSAALLTAAVVGLATVAWPTTPGTGRDDDAAATPPPPDAPTTSLADAVPAVEGRDYEVLTTYTNRDLDADNGQYLDGYTEDGQVLFRDGPRAEQLYPRFSLLDPATGERRQLPELRGVGQDDTWPVGLGADRLVLTSTPGDGTGGLRAHVLERSGGPWRTVSWPTLPAADAFSAVVGPDGRLYALVPNTTGRPPEGGWPTGPDGEADDAGAEGSTYRLWSVSLDDPADVRDEDLTLGALAFTEDAMVWTDATNGAAGDVHVRDLATGAERSFDPHAGERCNLLSFDAAGDRVVMGQFCGTYAGGVRDDRVQVLTTDGDQVVTLQDSDVSGGLVGGPGADAVVAIEVLTGDRPGAYVYDLAAGRLLRLSGAVSNFALGGPTSDGAFFWDTPVNGRRGATQHLGRLLPVTAG